MTEHHTCRPPALIQCATALADGLIADHLSMSVAGSTFGTCSGSAVAAVIDQYRAVLLDARPDVIDLYNARQRTITDGISDEFLASKMQHILSATLQAEPVNL